MKKLCREVWIEVDLDAIKKNVRAIRRHIPNTSKIMAVVKRTLMATALWK